MTRNQVIILSDAIGVGKTTALQAWIKKRSDVAGFLSPVVNGKRMFLNIETRAMIPMETDRKDLIVGKYAFDSTSFEQVEKYIMTSWEDPSTKLLIIDEIGPLEIFKDLGFHKLLLHLQEKITPHSPDLLLVVRATTLEAFLEKYNFGEVKTMSLAAFKNDFT